jgi:hypothetical protein
MIYTHKTVKSTINTPKSYFMSNDFFSDSLFSRYNNAFIKKLIGILFLDVYVPTGPKGYVSIISDRFLLFLNSTIFARKITGYIHIYIYNILQVLLSSRCGEKKTESMRKSLNNLIKSSYMSI